MVNQCYLCLGHVLTSSILLFEVLHVQCIKVLCVQCINNAMVQNVETMYYKFQKKKMTRTLVRVKIKSYATIPLSISFSWAWEGSLWPSSLKKYQKCTSLITSHQTLKTHLFRCTQCADGPLQNYPQITAFNTCIIQIFHEI